MCQTGVPVIEKTASQIMMPQWASLPPCTIPWVGSVLSPGRLWWQKAEFQQMILCVFVTHEVGTFVYNKQDPDVTDCSAYCTGESLEFIVNVH
ncbi:hypothetical protein XENTR_v10015041 [Xenopus tropicalis]|nr:hypothetical protein XENTR_v10015041 [Xenopus tropicalis]